jgi:SAM-dependent methyltransferase
MKQLKRSVTAYLSFTNAAYISKQEIAHQSTVVDSTNLTKSIEPISDDDSTNERHGREALDLWLYNRATTVHPIAAENTNQNSSMDYKLWYDSTSAKIPNISTYMENFCNMEFDNWGRTYNEMKDGMYSWKSHYFKDLKSNDSIYESACGIGMNLYMTLEILQQFGITNITISGNDFVPKSVQIAQEIYSRTVNGTPRHVLPSSFGQLGGIYEADSTQLDFIPSNSFDLVYTGYISPLNKPLDSTIDVSQPLVLAKRAQQLQDDWYGKWVGEMIRIAKPGVPIIVEQVSYPYVCSKWDFLVPVE